MVENIIILLILMMGIYTGVIRGLVLQAIHIAGYIITWIVANLFYSSLAKSIEMLIPYPSDTSANQLALYNLIQNVEFDKTFYNALAYILILIGGGILTRVIATALNKVTKIPIINQVNALGGGVLGFISSWLGLFFVLSFLSLLPITAVQDIFSSNSLAKMIVSQTPIVSDAILKTWLSYRS